MKLVALFSPEHGIAGKLDQGRVENSKDSATGLADFQFVWRVTKAGGRATGTASMRWCSIFKTRACVFTRTPRRWAIAWRPQRKITSRFMCWTGRIRSAAKIEGPVLDRDKTAFVAYFPMPIIYGMTLGELAQMFNAENKIGAELHVVKMERLEAQRDLR